MKSVRNTSKGGVVVNCASSEDINKLKNLAVSKLGDNYNISIPSKNNPRVRIVDISIQYSENEFIKLFMEQNKDLLSHQCVPKVINMYSIRNQPRFGVKLELDAQTFKKHRCR